MPNKLFVGGKRGTRTMNPADVFQAMRRASSAEGFGKRKSKRAHFRATPALGVWKGQVEPSYIYQTRGLNKGALGNLTSGLGQEDFYYENKKGYGLTNAGISTRTKLVVIVSSKRINPEWFLRSITAEGLRYKYQNLFEGGTLYHTSSGFKVESAVFEEEKAKPLLAKAKRFAARLSRAGIKTRVQLVRA